MKANHTLDEAFIARQRSRLEAMRDELTGAGDAQAAAEADAEETRGAEAGEYEDAAQSLDRKDVLQAKDELDRRRLASIERALNKIERGTYGISEVSGKPIPEQRLEAQPEAVTTVEEARAGG